MVFLHLLLEAVDLTRGPGVEVLKGLASLAQEPPELRGLLLDVGAQGQE